MKDDVLRPYAEIFCEDSGDKWKLVDRIGSGNSASVYKLEGDDQTAALKIYQPRFFQGDKASIEQRRVRDQMRLKGHEHPNLIDFFQEGKVKDTCFLLMEFFPWQSLDRRLHAIEPSEIAEIISKIANAAEYLESRDFVHRDIKPENILISDDRKEVKLLDLGVMRPISTEDSDGTDHGYALPFVATAQYSSPAYLFRDGHPTEDMWRALTFYQLGAVLHDLLMKRPLFANEVRTGNRYRVAAAVLLTDPEIRAPHALPRLVALARNCLVKDDRVRLNRVSWNSFHLERPTDIDEQRRRLGLGGSRDEIHPDSGFNSQRQEQIRVHLDNAHDFLINLCRHVLLSEGFPQASMTEGQEESDSRSFRFSFLPRNAAREATRLHFLFRLSLQKEPHDWIAVHFAAILTKYGGTLCNFGSDLLWSTKLDKLEADVTQLTSLLTEKFIILYAAADDQLSIFEQGSDSTFEVKVED